MFTLPNLNYAKNALDPAMSVETLDLHHSKAPPNLYNKFK